MVNKNIHARIKSVIAPLYYLLFDVIDFKGKNRLVTNVSLKNTHKGKRDFLVCSGSSINDIDLKFLENEETMCIGQMYLHRSLSELKPKMFLLGETYKNIINNKNYIHQYKNPVFPEFKDRDYFDKYNEYLKSEGSRDSWYCNQIDQSFKEGSTVFVKSEDYAFVKQKKLYLNKKVVYTKYAGISNKNEFTIDDLDLTKRMFSFNAGSITCALTTLMYMGFSEIYLLGAGYTMKPRLELHFYDNYIFPKEMGYEKALIKANEIISAHNKYFKSNIKLFKLYEKDGYYYSQFVQEFKDDENSMAHKQINNLANANNIKIRNVVPDGFESPIYEKIYWNEVEDILKKRV
jgi:hypothetical protein